MFAITPVDAFVHVNKLSFHYRRWCGERLRPDAPPLLLLHGLASAASIWNLVAPILAEQGYEVIALDQRGHGESAKPEQGYTFADIRADDQAVVRELGLQRPVIVGHSWGAMTGLEYAAVPGAEVSGLVLVDGATQQLSRRPGWSLEQALIDLAPPRYAGVTRETFLSFYAKSPLAHIWTPEIEASILSMVELHPDGTVSPRLTFERHLQIIEAMWYQPTLELYTRVTCPLKLIVAERTPTTDAERIRLEQRQQSLDEIRQMCPDVQIVQMPDTIHDIPFQRPAELAVEILHLLAVTSSASSAT